MFQSFYNSPMEKVLSYNKSTGVDLLKCTRSNYFTWNIIPSDEELSDYYHGPYIAANESWYTPENAYHDWPQYTRFISIMKRLTNTYIKKDNNSSIDDYSGISIHDIGCSYGGTVGRLREAGFDATGTDLSEKSIATGKAYANNNHIFCASAKDYLTSVNCIPHIFYSHHVLEHIPNPVAFIQDLHSLMGDTSVAHFLFPNGNAYPMALGEYQKYTWFGYPYHLHFFGPYAACRLLMDNGFSILEISSTPHFREFNINEIKELFLPNAPDAIFDYDSFLSMLSRNFMASELELIFCRSDSAIARENKEKIDRALELFAFFEEHRM